MCRKRHGSTSQSSTATALLTELLPIHDSISVTSVKRRVRVVGKALEESSARLPSAEAVPPVAPYRKLSAVAVDSAWLRHCDPPRELGQGRHVNVVAGRACFEDDQSRVCAYVHNQVSSAAERLDGFLRASGVDPNARVTILTDGAGEFEKAANGCAQPSCRILDWFHIAMKFEAAETSVFGCNVIGSLEREAVQREIRGAKWLVWHGKGTKAAARIDALDAKLLRRPNLRVFQAVVESSQGLGLPAFACRLPGQLCQTPSQGTARSAAALPSRPSTRWSACGWRRSSRSLVRRGRTPPGAGSRT